MGRVRGDELSIGRGILWVLLWFGFMLLYTALDVMLWRRISPEYSSYIDMFSNALCIFVFLALLTGKNNYKPALLDNVSVKGILLAAGCALLFYVILDRGLDPVFEELFPVSEESYEETVGSLMSAPAAGFIKVCIFAPFTEEILMRDFLLGGLRKKYGCTAALLLSAFLFALLHFNMVQTLSAFICGIVLGLLYLHTGSVFCCMLAHMGYNLISYTALLLPLISTAG